MHSGAIGFVKTVNLYFAIGVQHQHAAGQFIACLDERLGQRLRIPCIQKRRRLYRPFFKAGPVGAYPLFKQVTAQHVCQCSRHVRKERPIMRNKAISTLDLTLAKGLIIPVGEIIPHSPFGEDELRLCWILLYLFA